MKFTTTVLVFALTVAAVQALPIEPEADPIQDSVLVIPAKDEQRWKRGLDFEADPIWDSVPVIPAKDEQRW